MKKRISILCVLMMLVSLLSICNVANAAVDGLTIKAVFKGYETIPYAGVDYRYANIEFEVSYPRTFSAYTETPGTPPLFQATYSGDFMMASGFEFGLENNNGFTITAVTPLNGFSVNTNKNKIDYAKTEYADGYVGDAAFTLAKVQYFAATDDSKATVAFKDATANGYYVVSNALKTWGYSLSDFNVANCDVPSYNEWLASQGGGSEEIFDVKEETVAGTKVAFFAKNVTGEALAAGTYGIIFGNKTYPAGVGYDPETGAEVSYACPKDGSWVVGFADSKGKLSGDYKYQAYYKLNGETKTTAEKDINIQ